MALEHGDLFFINRSGSTYKIEAVELGNYLTGNSLDDGTYIVNDGLLSISNKGNDALQPFVITSANTPLNSVIDFDENFIVRSVGNDASITLNYDHVSSAILCSDDQGNTPGFSENNCGCISFDWDYFSDRLPCPDGGIVNDNGCLEINACDGGVIGFYSSGTPKEACVDVNLCGGGVINDGGCLDLDYALIANKIVCSPDSGLNNTAGDKCISVNFEKVMAEMGLGVLKSLDNSVLFTNNGDLTTGDVDLKVNPLVVQDTKINKIVATGKCLSVDGNDDLTQGDVKINMSEVCLKQFIIDNSGGGTIDPGDGSITICADGGLGLGPDGCLKIDQTETNDFCPSWYTHVVGQKLFLRESGGQAEPGIILGIERAASGEEIEGRNGMIKIPWIGLHSNQNNGSLTVIRGIKGWKNYDDPCGGEPKESDKNELVFSVAKGTKVLPHHKTSGLMKSKNKNNGIVVCWNDDAKGDDTLNSGPPEGDGNVNRMGFDIENFDIELINNLSRADLPELDVNIDDLVESFAGFADDPETPTGIARWGAKEVGVGGLTYPFLFVDTDELAERAPLLVNWDLKQNVYEKVYDESSYDDEGNEVPSTNYDWQLPDRELTKDDLTPGTLNKTGLHILAMLGLKKAKARIDELEGQLATLEARLTAAGIP